MWCVLLAGCRALFGIDGVSGDASSDASSAIPDASSAIPDAALPACDLDAPFGAPALLASLMTPTGEGEPRLSLDELTIYFDVRTSYGYAIYVATRPSVADAFGSAAELTAIETYDGSAVTSSWPSPSPDGLSLYFQSARGGQNTIFRATRAAITDAFGSAEAVGSNLDSMPYVVASGSAVYFASEGRTAESSGYTLYRGALATGVVTALTGIDGMDGAADDRGPAVTGDELTAYFCRYDEACTIYVATRPDAQSAWSAAQPLADAALSSVDQAPGWVSPDGCRLYIRQTDSDDDDRDHLYELARP